MHISIRNKLFITLLLAIVLMVVAMSAFMHWSFQRGFVSFLETRQQARAERLAGLLATIYEEEGGFDSLRRDRMRWFRLQVEGRLAPPERVAPGEMAGHARGAGHGRMPRELGLSLLDQDRQPLIGRRDGVENLLLTPIQVAGTTVGYVGRAPGPALREMVDVRFEADQRRAFLAIALVVGLLAMALAWPLSNTLVRPVRRIAEGARALALGRFQTRVDGVGQDELGDLARDFNALAQTLERTEAARRQWMADISHELRTPLALLKAELEALQDGVRPLEPGTVAVLQGDVDRLGRLVDDLYQLSMTDLGAMAYQRRDVDPSALLRDDVEAMTGAFSRQGLEITLNDGMTEPVVVQADPDRLSQLFRNLLQNSLRYTDPGGRLVVTMTRRGQAWCVDFQDTAPGVPAEALPRLFDRFYRVEASRSRAHGGAGLGLAICRNIVEAHGGVIQAQASPLGGLGVHLELPIP